jgi:hypothetical protein
MAYWLINTADERGASSSDQSSPMSEDRGKVPTPYNNLVLTKCERMRQSFSYKGRSLLLIIFVLLLMMPLLACEGSTNSGGGPASYPGVTPTPGDNNGPSAYPSVQPTQPPGENNGPSAYPSVGGTPTPSSTP